MRHPIRAIAALLVGALLLAGCGGAGLRIEATSLRLPAASTPASLPDSELGPDLARRSAQLERFYGLVAAIDGERVGRYLHARWYASAIFAASLEQRRRASYARPRETTRSTPSRSSASSRSVWDRLAACESGGRWDLSTGNGFYGGLQWVPSTFHAYGGVGRPQDASRETQIAVAERLLAASGGRFTAWPGCRRKLGLP